MKQVRSSIQRCEFDRNKVDKDVWIKVQDAVPFMVIRWLPTNQQLAELVGEAWIVSA